MRAAALWALEDEDLEALVAAGRLTKEEKRWAVEARKPRAKAAYGLQIAHEQTMTSLRGAQNGGPVNVNIAVVQLPALAPRRLDADVKVIDVETTGGELMPIQEK